MRHVNRLLLYVLLLAGVARMGLFLAYAVLELPSPLETYYLEAKMAHLSWRVQHGDGLYPDWRNFPYVCNFFGPCYFLVVGLIGRAFDADLERLLTIGRAVTLASALLSTAVVGLYLGRRFGAGAALAGAVLSLGSFPMYGFAAMNRPDLASELFGAAGFFLAIRRDRPSWASGCVLLVLAALTKQTTLTFLIAAAIVPWIEGRRRRAALSLAVVLGGLAAIVGVVTATVEPRFAASLLGESVMPWDFGYWRFIMGEFVRNSPDLIFFTLVGLVLWTATRPRQVAPATLAVVLVVLCTVLAMKRGSSVNYFISLRLVAGLAVGTLWHLVSDPHTGRRPWLAPLLVLGIASLYPSTHHMLSATATVLGKREVLRSPPGRANLMLHRRLCALARDPDSLLLTDDGLIDIHHGDRTVFADAWLFRQLVRVGDIDPQELIARVDRGEYELIVTRHDLFSPSYEGYDFGLPMPVAQRARLRYRPSETLGSYFLYIPSTPSGLPLTRRRPSSDNAPGPLVPARVAPRRALSPRPDRPRISLAPPHAARHDRRGEGAEPGESAFPSTPAE